MIKQMTRSISIYHEGESPIFGESTLHIELDDEAGGMFLVITGYDGQKVGINPNELEHVYQACKSLLAQDGVE